MMRVRACARTKGSKMLGIGLKPLRIQSRLEQLWLIGALQQSGHPVIGDLIDLRVSHRNGHQNRRAWTSCRQFIRHSVDVHPHSSRSHTCSTFTAATGERWGENQVCSSFIARMFEIPVPGLRRELSKHELVH